jgi:hypothetical protein
VIREQISRASHDARRQDARDKIELGGLVIKAGLREIDRAVILAILMEGAAKVSDPDEHERLRRVGTMALGGTV